MARLPNQAFSPGFPLVTIFRFARYWVTINAFLDGSSYTCERYEKFFLQFLTFSLQTIDFYFFYASVPFLAVGFDPSPMFRQ